MILIGDVHGQFDWYQMIVKAMPDDITVQVGDMGMFPGPRTEGFIDSFSQYFAKTNKDFFIRGNHDCPAICKEQPNYLGDYGIFGADGKEIFFVSGAWSIDYMMRTSGVSWWEDEELSIASLNRAIEQFSMLRPRYVVTHDAPEEVALALLNRFDETSMRNRIIKTRTGQALQAMLEIHSPEKWFFGHHHTNWKKQIRGCDFRCIASQSYCAL